MTVKVTINGEQTQIAARNIASLLLERGVDLDSNGLAVAHNGAVIPRAAWKSTNLHDGDTLEIVKPFSGG